MGGGNLSLWCAKARLSTVPCLCKTCRQDLDHPTTIQHHKLHHNPHTIPLPPPSNYTASTCCEPITVHQFNLAVYVTACMDVTREAIHHPTHLSKRVCRRTGFKKHFVSAHKYIRCTSSGLTASPFTSKASKASITKALNTLTDRSSREGQRGTHECRPPWPSAQGHTRMQATLAKCPGVHTELMNEAKGSVFIHINLLMYIEVQCYIVTTGE